MIAALAQDVLDIADKRRSNLFAWRGQFSPELIEALLKAYAPAGAFVLDPFAGSGTVLCEASRLGLSALGSEINPAAAIMARTYKLVNVLQERRTAVVDDVQRCIDRIVPSRLLAVRDPSAMKTQEEIMGLLVGFREEVETAEARKILETLIVILDVSANEVDEYLVVSEWKALKKLIFSLPSSAAKIDVVFCDARRLPLPDGCVDLVVTSPPYINVFNYHQQYRRSAELLGWNVLRIAKSEIGSNRKHRQNRFLTVCQYCLDMFEVLRELHRVCNRRGHVIIVVGRESNVRKTPFFNSEIVETIAERCVGFRCDLRQERAFQNRFGQTIYEDLLHLVKPRETLATQAQCEPLTIARETLRSAVGRAPGEVQSDLEAALQSLATVRPSPLFDISRVRSDCYGVLRI